MSKGVRFTVDIPGNSPRAFIMTRRPYERLGECYKLIDGRYLIIIKARDYNELIRIVEGIDDKMELFMAIGVVGRNVVPMGLVCDYRGGPISMPIIYRRGRRTYYLCCETCLRELKKKLNKSKDKLGN